MRKIFLLLTITFSNFLYAQNTQSIYQQLASVNEQWKYQNDVSNDLKNTEAKPIAEQQLLQLHLQQTELLLRNRDVSHLSADLKKQRAKNLDILHGYWKRGLFPINEIHEGRQPYFIDKVNTYCAVGYLMQQTGGDEIARDIKATQNFSYLLDIHHPKLMNWVAHSGLSIDELALIQVPYFGDSPALLTEMHYNNIGTDVNEYIEIRQSLLDIESLNGIDKPFDKIYFYDQTNTLYKTLSISQMQHLGSGGGGNLYYFNFSGLDTFADVGYFEIKSLQKLIWRTTYNQSSVTTYRLTSQNGSDENNYTTKVFNVGENETTTIGSSLSFCGLFTNQITLQSVTASFGQVNGCLSLPILLSKFEYTINKNIVNLLWETESENKISYFEIERSINGINFTTIGKVNAIGNSNTTKQYLFNDENANYLNHYRLKQVDIDGKVDYSRLLFVKIAQASPVIIKTNPVKNNLQLQISIDPSKIKSILLYDFMGRQLKTINAISRYQNVDISNLAIGKYLLQVVTIDNKGYNLPFIKAE